MMNISPAAATDEPASLPTPSCAARPLARLSGRLVVDLIQPALSSGCDARPGRAQRRDGWTPDRIRTFLEALAECGVVEDAARAAGMGRQSAYKLRARSGGRAFHVAWNAAEHLGRRRLASAAMSRAIHGCVEVIVRGGEVWGERHRFDNRLTMAVLARLDRNAAANDEENRVARLVAEEFDQFLDIVCAGGEGAAEFIAARVEADAWTASREARTLERCDNYDRYGVGLPEEIDVSDLDSDDPESWTPEQRERAARAGLLDEGDDEEEDDLDPEAFEDEDDYEDEEQEDEDEDDLDPDPAGTAAWRASCGAAGIADLDAPERGPVASGPSAGIAPSTAEAAFEHYPGWVAPD